MNAAYPPVVTTLTIKEVTFQLYAHRQLSEDEAVMYVVAALRQMKPKDRPKRGKTLHIPLYSLE